jgi:hypothetical protein
MEPKQQFIELYRTHIARQGAEDLLAWMERTDFFTAPASTRFHLNEAGGLVRHSLNVTGLLMQHQDENPESLALCGLLHDLCKANYYKASLRNVKNEQTGQWEKQPYYQIEDAFPYGHGEKSVFLIERFMRLKTAEAVAIRWHMGGFDEAVRGGSFAIGHAYARYPLAVKLHIADLQASYLIEAAAAEKSL